VFDSPNDKLTKINSALYNAFIINKSFSNYKY